MLGPDGAVREWIGTVTDAEDRWLAEERLRQADRMESVGRLAGGIAHEANNQMTVILGAAEFLARAIRDECARMDVEHIRRAARRTAAITQQLLAFSRRQVLQPQLVDLNAVVTDAGADPPAGAGRDLPGRAPARRTTWARSRPIPGSSTRSCSTWRSTPATPCRTAARSPSRR